MNIPFGFTNLNYQPLKDADFIRSAAKLNCEVEAVKAVAEIESGPQGGYLPNGKPAILFESRLFNDYTDDVFLHSHPHLATGRWAQNYTRDEYARLEEAIWLNLDAALKSCSWGRFQVLGANHRRVGFKNVVDYVVDVVNEGEASHLNHFTQFVITGHIDDELRRLDWHGFSRVYNGPGYRKHKYAKRMQSSYVRFKGGDQLMHNGRLMTNEDLQLALVKHGFLMSTQVDGVVGEITRAALSQFEAANDLEVNGVVDGPEWDALMEVA